MRLKLRILVMFFLFTGLICGVLFAFNSNNRSRIVKPVANEQDVVITHSFYELISGSDPTMERLVHVAYISGFLDALQMEQANMPEAKNFLTQCQGMNMGDLTEAMLGFYRDNPQWRETKPATVLTIVIPRLKKGLKPFPDSSEK